MIIQHSPRGIILIILFAFFLFDLSYSQEEYFKHSIDSEIAAKHLSNLNPKKSDIKQLNIWKDLLPNNSINWCRSMVTYNIEHYISQDIQDTIDFKTRIKMSINPELIEGELITNSGGPGIENSFEGNTFNNYTPSDNSIAISNNGLIISVTNSLIEYYHTDGSLFFSTSFDDFFNDNALTSIIYDPVVLYDPTMDRFFLVVLHGTSSATSQVLTCFSKTNNPLDGWWVYKISGDPTNNNSWFDYPKIGFSTHDVFITGNLFYDSGNYNESIIFQISKIQGYNGQTLDYLYWYNITNSPFTFVPVSYGQNGSYGPGIYLISSDPDGNGSDEFLLGDITNNLNEDPELNIFTINAEYTLGGNALQKGSNVLLDCNDNRLLSGYYLNGQIFFVFHSEYGQGFNGINFNRLIISNLSVVSHKYGAIGYDYTFPSIASFGINEYNKSVLICFLKSGSSMYPEVRVVGINNGGDWTNSTLVKEGESYVNVLAEDNVARWGDYTGIARRYNNSSPEVWVCGAFGNNGHSYNSWIAQVSELYVDFSENQTTSPFGLKLFPNPVVDAFNLEFETYKRSLVEISLTDIDGHLIKILFKDYLDKGFNEFSFNRNMLKKGIYLLTLKNDEMPISVKKIVVN